MARVAFGGVTRRVCVEHVPEAVVGDYVLVHVGFALSRIDEEEALRVFELLAELGEATEPGELTEPGGSAPSQGAEEPAA